MKTGDLVKWTLSFSVMRRKDAGDTIDYSQQVGIVLRDWDFGYIIQWSDGFTRKVHKDYVRKI